MKNSRKYKPATPDYVNLKFVPRGERSKEALRDLKTGLIAMFIILDYNWKGGWGLRVEIAVDVW